ncbi:tRNA lysidine(34) synthetase TilS [Candidatus Gracilibacteria bacterium]|nr:tRNA lysidine(34) synthetase TilS [Candidatus Gracilibacteria bacterium]
MNLKKIFVDFLKQEKLVGKKLLLAVSGGVDSTVLLEVASKTVDTKNLAVFHLNHGSRKESSRDLDFVQKICSEKGIKFYGEKLTKAPAKNKEEFWRDQRKKLAQKVAKDFGANRIITAHHATDLVETMLFRLTKGCGAGGLSPFNTSTKPFWNVPRSEIEQYAKTHKLKFVTDKSNTDIKYDRNLIRHKIIPVLRSITPNLEKVFVTESEIFAEINSFLFNSVKNKYARSLKEKNIPLSEFITLPIILQAEFLRLISTKTPSFDETQDCLKWLLGNPKGNSSKKIGGTTIYFQNKNISW